MGKCISLYVSPHFPKEICGKMFLGASYKKKTPWEHGKHGGAPSHPKGHIPIEQWFFHSFSGISESSLLICLWIQSLSYTAMLNGKHVSKPYNKRSWYFNYTEHSIYCHLLVRYIYKMSFTNTSKILPWEDYFYFNNQRTYITIIVD